VATIVLSTINAKWIHPSLALRLLKANLPPRGSKDCPDNQDCVILEFALRQPLAEKTAAILAAAPGILAISVSVWNHEATLELLRALETAWAKAATPGTISEHKPPVAAKPVIVLGGPEVTGLIDSFRANPQGAGESALQDLSGHADEPELFRHADFVISGEGEAAFAGLCRTILDDPAMPMAAKISAAKKHYGKYIKASPVDPAAINGAYDLYTGEDLRQKLIYVESSRSCPFSCAFCQSAVKHGQETPGPVREFPLEEFLAGLEKLLQRGIEKTVIENSAVENSVKNKKTTTIKFLDRSFNVNIPRALAILEFCLGYTGGARNPQTLFLRDYPRNPRTKTGNRFQFHFEMVPAIFPPELRSMLARFPPGSIRLEIGIQSFNPQTCAAIHRASNPEKELEVLKFLREKTNAIVHADLIAGLFGEDIESFGRGFDMLWAALNSGNAEPFEIQLGILKCLPGTPIHAMAESGQFAVTYNKSPPYEVIETDCLSAADMEKIKNFARFWELLVNRPGFSDLLPQLAPSSGAPAATPVFARFMELSQKLLAHFGRNYGIPKEELKTFLLNFAP